MSVLAFRLHTLPDWNRNASGLPQGLLRDSFEEASTGVRRSGSAFGRRLIGVCKFTQAIHRFAQRF
jgi:hypothetical protein